MTRFIYDSYLYDADNLDNCQDYAYRISSLDPVEARLIMETQYAWALSLGQLGLKSYVPELYPQAMCALDLDRAQAMLDDLIKRDPRDAFRRQRFMRYILMSSEERASMHLVDF